MILSVLENEELHGWGVSRRIRELSRDVLVVNQGSLYPALSGSQPAGCSSRVGGTPRTAAGEA